MTEYLQFKALHKDTMQAWLTQSEFVGRMFDICLAGLDEIKSLSSDIKVRISDSLLECIQYARKLKEIVESDVYIKIDEEPSAYIRLQLQLCDDLLTKQLAITHENEEKYDQLYQLQTKIRSIYHLEQVDFAHWSTPRWRKLHMFPLASVLSQSMTLQEFAKLTSDSLFPMTHYFIFAVLRNMIFEPEAQKCANQLIEIYESTHQNELRQQEWISSLTKYKRSIIQSLEEFVFEICDFAFRHDKAYEQFKNHVPVMIENELKQYEHMMIVLVENALSDSHSEAFKRFMSDRKRLSSFERSVKKAVDPAT